MKIELAKTEIIHFVGIGGIGMSGLALIMKRMGFNIQGSDLGYNRNSDNCKKISIAHYLYPQINHNQQHMFLFIV